MGSHLTATLGALLLSVLIASVEPASGAQQPTSSPPGQAAAAPANPPAAVEVDKLPISIDRIRQQLEREPALSLNLLRALDIPIFRVETRNDLVFKVDPRWWKDDDVGDFVRPTVNRWHYDFMKMTNPNLPTGYGPGGGVDVLPAVQSIFSGIRHISQEHERNRVRQQIQDELRAIDDARREAGLPPLEKAVTPPALQTDTTDSKDPKSNGTASSPQPTIRVNAPPARPSDPR